MEGFGHGGSSFTTSTAESVRKRRRSVPSRKPRSAEQLVNRYRDLSSCSISPADEEFPASASGDSGQRRKELYLNSLPQGQHSSMHRSIDSKKIKRQERGYDVSEVRRGSEGTLAHASLKGGFQNSAGSSDEPGGRAAPGVQCSSSENTLRKVKLKVGGVTRTIHTKNANSNIGQGSLQKSKKSQNFSLSHGDSLVDSHIVDKHQGFPISEPIRKSKRVPKRRMLDGESDEENEIRYLEKLKAPKIAQDVTVDRDDIVEDSFKKQKLSKATKNRSLLYELDEDFVVSRTRDRRRQKDTDEDGESGIGLDIVMDVKSKKSKEPAESPPEVKPEPLTTRQRALQGKGGNTERLIEFPDGLPPVPSRKQKEKLSEVEIQAKKAEAAQRRKLQVEKAAKEAEAEAIRKILGLDSDKKKEEKKQKEREEKEKAAKLQISGLPTIKWVMGPNGTVVSFPEDVGLPSILTSESISYPPPREKCAGPSCPKPYKYRDSKSKLPLCSLECYRAVRSQLTC